MACLGNSRFCARVQPEKLCQIILSNSNKNFLFGPGGGDGGGISSSSNSSVGCLGLQQIVGNNILLYKQNNSNNFAIQTITIIPTIAAPTTTTTATETITVSKIFQQLKNNNNNGTTNIKKSATGLLSYPKLIIKQNGFVRNYSTKSKNVVTSSHHHLPSRIAVTEKTVNKYNESNSKNTTNNSIRGYSSVHHTQQPAGPVREIQIDPYSLIDDDLKYFYKNIQNTEEEYFINGSSAKTAKPFGSYNFSSNIAHNIVLQKGTNQPELARIASYYFDGQGKAFRPMLVMLMARSINYHMNTESSNLLDRQRTVAVFAEMIHSASLVHDDVIDQSDFRRGKPSVNAIWSHKKVTMAGDYILSVASILISRLQNNEVTLALQQICTDLVQGEFMQLGAKETENERFAHYLSKTYKKTASLIANALKSVAILADANDELCDIAFQYGRNIGLAFQLVDDMLDFVSSAEAMGKPTAADLKLGLATAPALFACEKYPELNPMIMRHFREAGDVERAFELVHKSQGLEQTKFLARKHCIEAIRLAQELSDSPFQKGLIVAADLVINRMK